MSSKLNEVQQRLSEIDATRFHKLVDSYLSKNIITLSTLQEQKERTTEKEP